MRYPGFIGGYGTAQSPTAAIERTVNWYVELAETPAAKSRAALYPTPAVTQWVEVSASSPIRGLIVAEERLFAVAGTTCYEISPLGVVRSLGSVGSGTGPVTLAYNNLGGRQLACASGGVLSLWDLAQEPPVALTPVWKGTSNPVTFVASMVTMLDGYFIVLDANTSQFYLSELLDGQQWDPLQVVQRSSQGDRWVAVSVVGRDLWLFGKETSEVWYNAGGSPFPFAQHASGVVQIGCAAPASVVPIGDVVLWLAQDRHGVGQVVLAQGLTPKVVSTRAIEWAWQSYTTLSDAVGFAHQWAGHVFYVLTFPTANRTWVYDLTTGLWHERGVWNPSLQQFEAWRGLFHAVAYGKRLVGDRTVGRLYTLTDGYGMDANGAPIRRLRQAPVLHNEGQRLFFHRFTLDLEVGLGVYGQPSQDPEIELWYSNDNGKTWANAGARQSDSGMQGQTRQRVFWTRLGSARNRVFQVVTDDPIPWRLVDAYLELTPGRA